MSLALLHSPADIARWLLVAKLVVTSPLTVPLPTWPAYNDGEPTDPDNVVTTYDHESQDDGRAMIDGEDFHHYGIQVRIRSVTAPIGYVKAEAIEQVMTESVYQDVITIGAATYEVQCFAKVKGTLRAGKESPTSKRNVFTINALMSLKRTS